MLSPGCWRATLPATCFVTAGYSLPAAKTQVPDGKTPWHWRTDGPGKSDQKLPNVSSETALQTRVAPGCWVLAADDWLPATCFVTAGYSLAAAKMQVPDGKTPWHWRTDGPGKNDQKLPNVSSETALQTRLAPGCWVLAAHDWLPPDAESWLLTTGCLLPASWLLATLLLAAPAAGCCKNIGPGRENTMALKDGWARKKWPKTA